MTQAVELWRYRALIGNFAQRELKAKYKKSVLGWLWSLINPASSLLIYTVVFGSFLKIEPPVGGNGRLHSFALYLFAALIVWNLFFSVVTGCMGSLLGAGPLLKKIYFPPEAPIMGAAVSVLLQTVIECSILVTVLLVVENASFTFLWLPYILFMLVLYSIGLGLVVGLVNVYFRDVNYLVSIGMNLLFYATPIIYPFRIIPKELAGVPVRTLVSLNPLTQFVGATRNILYDLQSPSALRLGGLTGASIGTFLIGRAVFSRRARDVAEEL